MQLPFGEDFYSFEQLEYCLPKTKNYCCNDLINYREDFFRQFDLLLLINGASKLDNPKLATKNKRRIDFLSNTFILINNYPKVFEFIHHYRNSLLD